VRVPLIIAGPGLPAGKRSGAMCYLFDLFPTLGELCRVPGPATSEGISFAAAVRDPSLAARPRLLFAYKNLQRAVREERWKLIRTPHADVTQLFDLAADPHETRDLAAEPAHTAEVARLSAALREEQAAFGDHAPWTAAQPRRGVWSPPARP
jgi:arylsulfatase A-like enzyme